MRFFCQTFPLRHGFCRPAKCRPCLHALRRRRDASQRFPCVDAPGLQYVCNLHEQAVAIAAEAHSRVTNHLSAAMVTTGPGGTNAVTGLAGAWLDSTPVLFISGQVKRADLKRDSGVRILGVQEIDIVTIVKSITKYAVTVEDPVSIRYHLEKAVHLANAGRRGPVWIDIPLDVQAAPG